jgi:hypothetical protein
MKRHAKFIVLTAVSAVLAVTAVLCANPLRRSDASVRAYLLRQVPPGSSIDTLRAVAQHEDWKIENTWSRGPHSGWGGIDGATVAWIYLGGYWSALRTDLDSFWAFDDRGKLIDVRLRRMTDAI